jgi:pyruvate dehydrogenase E2 component (dihydrolipoamide acetyltransferase)
MPESSSMVTFVMPKLGADMTAGRLVAWCRQPGEPVTRGDVIAVIQTDKVNVDAESFVTGVLERVLAEPGDAWLPVGTPLAEILVEGEVAATAPAETPLAPARTLATHPETLLAPAETPLAPTQTLPPGVTLPAAAAARERLRISPAARKRSEDLGIDPTRLAGSGPGGRLTLEDVERAAAAPRATAPPAVAPAAEAPVAEAAVGEPSVVPVAAPAANVPAERQQRMRDAIAAAMSRAKREIPHYYLATTIDMANALAWLAAYNGQRPATERILYGALLVKASALALREVPELNGFWRDGRAEPSRAIHVGVAISLRGGGLVAPALHDADRQSVPDLMRALQDLTQRARAHSLRSTEMTDPTVTLTSLGERGVESVYGIIYPPQLALVGFGRIVERPWVVAGAVVARPVLTATLAGDHRATDGHRGALFLAAVDRLLQQPASL